MCRATGVARPRLAISTLRLAESFLRFMRSGSRQQTTTNWLRKRSRSRWVIAVGEDRPFSTTTCSSDGDVFTYLLTKARERIFLLQETFSPSLLRLQRFAEVLNHPTEGLLPVLLSEKEVNLSDHRCKMLAMLSVIPYQSFSVSSPFASGDGGLARVLRSRRQFMASDASPFVNGTLSRCVAHCG